MADSANFIPKGTVTLRFVAVSMDRPPLFVESHVALSCTIQQAELVLRWLYKHLQADEGEVRDTAFAQ